MPLLRPPSPSAETLDYVRKDSPGRFTNKRVDRSRGARQLGIMAAEEDIV